MKKLKICNVKNIYETRTAGHLEIPFLGFHLISTNDFARISSIKDCVRELREYFPSSKAILVTKEKDIKKLISTIKEVEFDGAQLHYENSDVQAGSLKSYFGNSFIVIQVVTSEKKELAGIDSDYILLDRSYLGGTGKQISLLELKSILGRNSDRKVILAGGISPANIHQYLNLPIMGFDIQSYLKSENASSTENIDYLKLKNTANLLGYKLTDNAKQVGFAVQDIKQENQNMFIRAFDVGVDFFHIDISDGFVGEPTDIKKSNELIDTILSTNSHLVLQLHLFVSSQKKYEEFLGKLPRLFRNNSKTFIHINRDNYANFDSKFIKKPEVFFGLDVKDIIDETYPWEQFIKSDIILCMQSIQHADRIINLNRALKLIRYASKTKPIITLDRGIDFEVIIKLENTKNINVACGSYLRNNIRQNYRRLKDYLNEEN